MPPIKLIIGLLLVCLVSVAYSGELVSPEGLWKTYDDDGNATGFVRIVKDNASYMGMIEKGLPADKDEQYCTACRDERKDQKLIGMTIIKNVKAHSEIYDGGEILDPFSGNTYRVKLTLKDAGNKLEVRGFLGISLFGRTQVWERVANGK